MTHYRRVTRKQQEMRDKDAANSSSTDGALENRENDDAEDL